MKTKSGNYFLVGTRSLVTNDKGEQVKATDQYVVEAVSWTDCEANTTAFMSGFNSEDFSIPTMKKASFQEIFLSEDGETSRFYECTVAYIVLDEKTGKEKRSKCRYLVEGESVERAKKGIDEVLKSTMVDYDIVCIKETNIVDIIFAE